MSKWDPIAFFLIPSLIFFIFAWYSRRQSINAYKALNCPTDRRRVIKHLELLFKSATGEEKVEIDYDQCDLVAFNFLERASFRAGVVCLAIALILSIFLP